MVCHLYMHLSSFTSCLLLILLKIMKKRGHFTPQENNVCSTSQCTSTDAPLRSVPDPPTSKCTQEIQAGKSCQSSQRKKETMTLI